MLRLGGFRAFAFFLFIPFVVFAETTDLHRAAQAGDEAAVRRLLQERVWVEARDDFGRTALYLAARYGHEGVVRMLLAADAEGDAIDNLGRMPLHLAAEHGYFKVALLLLRSDVGVDRLDAYVDASLLALHGVCGTGRNAITEYLRDLNLQEWRQPLLSLFWKVIAQDDLEVVRELIVVEKNRRVYVSPLSNQCECLRRLTHVAMYAAQRNRGIILQALLDAGVHAWGSDEEGNTLLMQAIHFGSVDALRVLLAAGANPGPVEPGGLSVLAEVQEMIDAFDEFAALDAPDLDDSDRLRPSRVSEDERRALEWPVRGRLEQYLVIRALLRGVAPVEVPVVVLPAEPVLGPNEFSSSSAAGPSRRSW